MQSNIGIPTNPTDILNQGMQQVPGLLNYFNQPKAPPKSCDIEKMRCDLYQKILDKFAIPTNVTRINSQLMEVVSKTINSKEFAIHLIQNYYNAITNNLYNQLYSFNVDFQTYIIANFLINHFSDMKSKNNTYDDDVLYSYLEKKLLENISRKVESLPQLPPAEIYVPTNPDEMLLIEIDKTLREAASKIIVDITIQNVAEETRKALDKQITDMYQNHMYKVLETTFQDQFYVYKTVNTILRRSDDLRKKVVDFVNENITIQNDSLLKSQVFKTFGIGIDVPSFTDTNTPDEQIPPMKISEIKLPENSTGNPADTVGDNNTTNNSTSVLNTNAGDSATNTTSLNTENTNTNKSATDILNPDDIKVTYDDSKPNQNVTGEKTDFLDSLKTSVPTISNLSNASDSLTSVPLPNASNLSNALDSLKTSMTKSVNNPNTGGGRKTKKIRRHRRMRMTKKRGSNIKRSRMTNTKQRKTRKS